MSYPLADVALVKSEPIGRKILPLDGGIVVVIEVVDDDHLLAPFDELREKA